jgi:hypothetical protein
MIFERVLQPTHTRLLTCRANYEKLCRKLEQSAANNKIWSVLDSFCRSLAPLPNERELGALENNER